MNQPIQLLNTITVRNNYTRCETFCSSKIRLFHFFMSSIKHTIQDIWSRRRLLHVEIHSGAWTVDWKNYKLNHSLFTSMSLIKIDFLRKPWHEKKRKCEHNDLALCQINELMLKHCMYFNLHAFVTVISYGCLITIKTHPKAYRAINY